MKPQHRHSISDSKQINLATTPNTKLTLLREVEWKHPLFKQRSCENLSELWHKLPSARHMHFDVVVTILRVVEMSPKVYNISKDKNSFVEKHVAVQNFFASDQTGQILVIEKSVVTFTQRTEIEHENSFKERQRTVTSSNHNAVIEGMVVCITDLIFTGVDYSAKVLRATVGEETQFVFNPQPDSYLTHFKSRLQRWLDQ